MIRVKKENHRSWFMSNYYPCEFVMNGIRYKNAEAAFQSHKVPLEERRQFADMPPASAKRFGRNVAIPANWDETRVDVKEDMFMTPKTVTEPAKHGDKSDSEKSMLEIGMEKMNQAYPMVSRAFVFNILEGFISGEKGIIQFPEPVSVVEQLTNPTSPYVVFSAADGWLDDNRYGNMADILNRCNERLTEGDMLLMTRYIRPNQGQYYSNDRGRGYTDRTHDCMLGDNAIYRLNLVEKTFEGHYLYVQFPPDKEKKSIRHRNDYTSPNGSPYAFRRMTCQDSKGIEQDKKSIEKEGGTVVDECDVISTHYYVSAKKRYSDNARSNVNNPA